MPADRQHIYYRHELTRHTTRGVPHWTMAGGIYFLTFRLADSIPRHELRRIAQQYERDRRAAMGAEDPALALEAVRIAYFDEHVEPLLEQGHGARHLRKPEVAFIVADTLRYFDGSRYALVAWAVMPTHVHVVFVLFEGWRIDQILHSLKSYTSNQAKKILALPKGVPFWARPYFDRIVRTEEELWNVTNYTRENPAQAGLEDWEWVGFNPEALRTSGKGR